jgi:hypothetical protein
MHTQVELLPEVHASMSVRVYQAMLIPASAYSRPIQVKCDIVLLHVVLYLTSSSI